MGRADVPDEPDDDALEEQLRQILERLDPVPGELLAAAIASYTWRTVDSELAELVFDSMTEENAALVRGGEQARLLSFEARGLVIEIQVSGSGPDRRIVGQLAPPTSATVQIRQAGSASDAGADELGRFSGPLGAGPFSLVCTAETGSSRPVVTEWIAI
jgi:hypothetical protein